MGADLLCASALLAPCLCLAGCLAAALGAVPSAVSMAGGGAAIATGSNDTIEQSDEQERCDQLAKSLPDIFQTRLGANGLEFRRLAVAEVGGRRKWVLLKAHGADAEGWSRGSPLASAVFSPPLGLSIDARRANYLVSAPLAERDPIDSQQMMSFTTLFAPATGSYRFQNRTYQYALTQNLPCFGTAF